MTSLKAEKKPRLKEAKSSNTSKKIEASSSHIGHRARLRDRFLKVGSEGLADYELLELLLFVALPRGDTKPLAKALINEFGSLKNIPGILR